MFASCQVLARGLLITSAHESKLPKGSWVLAGFAVDTSDRGEHIPFMWDREKPSDPPVQARICGTLGKVTFLKLQGFLKHTNSTMWSTDCDNRCSDDEMNKLKEHCAVLFPTAEQKAADAAASRSTVSTQPLACKGGGRRSGAASKNPPNNQKNSADKAPKEEESADAMMKRIEEEAEKKAKKEMDKYKKQLDAQKKKELAELKAKMEEGVYT